MNWLGIIAIWRFEMARFFRSVVQSMVSPVITTSLYFVVFGAAIGSRIDQVEGVNYGAFIVPGLIMLTVLQQSLQNASFGIYFPKFIGTIFEVLSAPLSAFEIVTGYVGAAAFKAFLIGMVILGTSFFFVDLRIEHPVFMLLFLVLTCVSFSLLGFILGIWASGHGHSSSSIWYRFSWSRRSSSSAGRFIRSRCCRRSGKRSRSSILSCTSSRASAGRSLAWLTSPSSPA